MYTRTKIICTIGPASRDKLKELILSGMNVARLNFSHGSYDDHKIVIDRLKALRKELDIPLAIMIDTKGPEIRVGKLKEPIELKAGSLLRLVKNEGKEGIQIDPEGVIDALSVGSVVRFDDGAINSSVVEKGEDYILLRIENEGILRSNKGVNLPGIDMDLPAMTERDIADISFAVKEGVDLIAASFIRSSDHVLEMKRLLLKLGQPDLRVLAKIENLQGVENFDHILQVADGIMVARGDLGVELPLADVPKMQKMMISKCLKVGKPVVTATQMLESMIKAPRPTRAEVSDVANAVYDGTTAVMLSAETAAGLYPIESVKMMKEVIASAESDFHYEDFFYANSRENARDLSSSIALAAVQTAYSTKSKAIFSFTNSGLTAQKISRFRPKMPVIALTADYKVYHQLALHWGITPLIFDEQNLMEGMKKAGELAQKMRFVSFGDLVIVTGGEPFGVRGTTNMMMVESIGSILVRGEGFSENDDLVEGKVRRVFTLADVKKTPISSEIVVVARFNATFEPFVKSAKALVLENQLEDIDSIKSAKLFTKKMKIPLIIRADGALGLLSDGGQVILDAKKGLVYLK